MGTHLVQMRVRVEGAGQAQAVDLHELEGGQLAGLHLAARGAHELHHRGGLAGAGHPGDVQALADGLVIFVCDGGFGGGSER